MYTNMLNGTIGICRSEGVAGLYRGLVPTVSVLKVTPDDGTIVRSRLTRQILKQGANSAVRFTSYSTLQQASLDYFKPESGKLSSVQTFTNGAIAGLITVCTSIRPIF